MSEEIESTEEKIIHHSRMKIISIIIGCLCFLILGVYIFTLDPSDLRGGSPYT